MVFVFVVAAVLVLAVLVSRGRGPESAQGAATSQRIAVTFVRDDPVAAAKYGIVAREISAQAPPLAAVNHPATVAAAPVPLLPSTAGVRTALPATTLATTAAPPPASTVDSASTSTGSTSTSSEDDDAADTTRPTEAAGDGAAPAIKPAIGTCLRNNSMPVDPDSARRGVALGCFRDAAAGLEEAGPADSAEGCMAACLAKGQASESPPLYYGLGPAKRCWCSRTFGEAVAEPAAACVGGVGAETGVSAVYRIGQWPPPDPAASNIPPTLSPALPLPQRTVAMRGGGSADLEKRVEIYLYANERLSTLFRTCRLTRFSRRFDEYVVYDLRHQVKTEADFRTGILARHAGFKIFVYDGCCTHSWALLNWPRFSVLVVTADETARWGFSSRKQYWGPHGMHGDLDTDASGRIVIPDPVKPWYKQYYSERHVREFGADVRYMPLGSRTEFRDPQTPPKPATQRKYIFSFIGAPTDPSRRKMAEAMRGDARWGARGFLYMPDKWDANPTSGRNTYMSPEEYQEVMADSIFTLCPRGNSVEQFRIYEALESGSIPVIAREEGYAEERLPPEYLHSPMLFVETWDELPNVLAALTADMPALLERQVQAWHWYRAFLQAKIDEIDELLVSRLAENRPPE